MSFKKYKCTVAYVGAAYNGWQSQKLGRSIQEQIEAVIRTITHEHTNITASGRTDAGVSARGQVFMFETSLDMSERKWRGAINGYLPKDIHIIKVEEVDPHLFHARYNVRMKHYDYCVNTGMYDVFTKDTAYQCPIPLDFEKMKAASGYLVGTHDFTSFNSNSLKEKPDQVRTIQKIEMKQDGPLITMSFYGKGFLRYMVRMMAAQLIEVGKRKIEPEDIEKMLAAKSKTIARRNAPANGLTLVEVDYFEMCAISEMGMIREFLLGDALPKGQTLESLEKAVKERKDPRWYALCGRHNQNVCGIFEVNANEAVVHLLDPAAKAIVESLDHDIRIWLGKQNISEDNLVISYSTETTVNV